MKTIPLYAYVTLCSIALVAISHADCTGCGSKPTSKSYIWDPQPDITSYELARALPLAMGWSRGSTMRAIEDAPPELRRHFKEQK